MRLKHAKWWFGALKSLRLKHAKSYPAHPESWSGYRSACLSLCQVSGSKRQPDRESGWAGYRRPGIWMGWIPFGVLKSHRLKRFKPPRARRGLERLSLWDLSTPNGGLQRLSLWDLSTPSFFWEGRYTNELGDIRMNWGSFFFGKTYEWIGRVIGRYTNELGIIFLGGRYTNELGIGFFLGGRDTNELGDLRMNWGSIFLGKTYGIRMGWIPFGQTSPPWVLLYVLLFPNLFPKDQLRCCLFISSCAPLSLPLSLSLFLFHLESLLWALLSFSRAC